MRKSLEFVMVVLLLFGLGQTAALASDTQIISADGAYTVSGSSPVVIQSGVKATVTLKDVSINTAGMGISPFAIQPNAEVTVILEGDNLLSADPKAVTAGLYVPEGAKLTIQGDGTLNVTGGECGAGIGSVKDVVSGTITVESGTINATGGEKGAGIGSGYHASAGTTTINGGTITAIGSGCGSGIGTGYGTSGGGSEAKVGSYHGGTITINGGTIRAAAFPIDFSKVDPMNPSGLAAYEKNTFAAGIGGGYGSSSGHISITGGDIIALGSCGGTGIGSGRGTSKADHYDATKFFVDVRISGSAKVLAMATDDTRDPSKPGGGAAIGSGRGSHTGGSIHITGTADVTAIASPYAAAIGAGSTVNPVDGSVPSADEIEITKGVRLYAVSNGYRYAVDTANGTKTFADITANIQQILFDASVLNASAATSFDLVFNGKTEKTLIVPAGMKSAAVDVANTGTYYLKSDQLYGVQKQDTFEYPSSAALSEQTCVALRAKAPDDQPGDIVLKDPVSLKNGGAYIFGKNNSSMAPDDYLVRGEACALLYRLLKQNNALGGFVFDENAAPAFMDLAGRWDRSAIEYMNYIHMYDNSKQTTISPDTAIVRKEAFKLFVLALGYTDQTDLTDEQYTSVLTGLKYVVGDETGDLHLNDRITRAEFCKIYNLITGRDAMPLVDANGNKITAESYGFKDLPKGEWYYEIMLKATSAYTDNYVDLSKRASRNDIDDYHN